MRAIVMASRMPLPLTAKLSAGIVRVHSAGQQV
jgi:hypothetical protein